MGERNFVTQIREDVCVLKAVLENGAPVTDMVLRGVWRWFQDVELQVPLPVMTLGAEERASLALTITCEMDAVFARIEAACEGLDAGEQLAFTQGPDAAAVNTLWRELAGCYAHLINSEVAEIPAEHLEEAHARAFESLCEQTGWSEDTLRENLRENTHFRMMLRMAGLDPDRIISS